jgi:hypothetical protein
MAATTNTNQINDSDHHDHDTAAAEYQPLLGSNSDIRNAAASSPANNNAHSITTNNMSPIRASSRGGGGGGIGGVGSPSSLPSSPEGSGPRKIKLYARRYWILAQMGALAFMVCFTFRLICFSLIHYLRIQIPKHLAIALHNGYMWNRLVINGLFGHLLIIGSGKHLVGMNAHSIISWVYILSLPFTYYLPISISAL